MGYSISVVCRSEALQQKMLLLLDKEYRQPWQVFEMRESLPGCSNFKSKLDYSKRKYQVGVDYGPFSGGGRLYIFTILHWMALKAGVRRSTFKEYKGLVLPDPVPYVLYDGYDCFPVITGKAPTPLRWCQVDEYGLVRDKMDTVRDLMWWFDLSKVPAVENPEGMTPIAYKRAFEKAIYKCFKKEIDHKLKLLSGELKRLDASWLAL